jgi:hypothetical protein
VKHMSRRNTRARNRRAQLEQARIEFERKREKPAALAAFLRRLQKSDVSIWSVARLVATDNPLDESELAMIAQIVAPHLAGMTPASVRRRALHQVRPDGCE